MEKAGQTSDTDQSNVYTETYGRGTVYPQQSKKIKSTDFLLLIKTVNFTKN